VRTLRLSLLFVVACGGGGGGAPDAPINADAAPPAVDLAVPCTDTTDQVYVLPTDLPAYDRSHRGDVFRCSRVGWLDAATLDAAAHAQGYVGPTLTSGATIFRIAYRTERAQAGSAPPAEGHSTAFALIPDHPRAAGAVAVYVHPSIGLAPSCAPSHGDLSIHGDGADQIRAPVLVLAGSGFYEIVPDLAGFSYGEPPGFSDAEDSGKSVLDATRAMAKLVPSPPTKVVIAGHSMGGHAALAAHALLPSYGAQGDVIGIVTFAPFWISNYAWGALMYNGLGYSTANAPYLFEYQLEYFWGHGELIDGPGMGVELIQPAKQAMVNQMMTTECIDAVAADMPKLGVDAQDYFDPTAASELSKCGIQDNCSTAPSTTWAPRFLADRPPVDGSGPPIVLWYGAMDGTILPTYAQCEQDTIHAAIGSGSTSVTACSDPDAVHVTVPQRNVAWAIQWIDATLDGTALPTCTPPVSQQCPNLPPNL
jgi:pimeloyl-ACP methyl ester carboxylesterase